MAKNYKKKSHYVSKKYSYSGKPKLFKRYTSPAYKEGLHNRIIECPMQVYLHNNYYSFDQGSTVREQRLSIQMNASSEFGLLKQAFALCKLNGVKVEVRPSLLNQLTALGQTGGLIEPLSFVWSLYGEVSASSTTAWRADETTVVNDKFAVTSKYYGCGSDLVQTGYQSGDNRVVAVTGGKIWTSTAVVDNLPDFAGTLYISNPYALPNIGSNGDKIYTIIVKLYMSYCKPGYWGTL